MYTPQHPQNSVKFRKKNPKKNIKHIAPRQCSWHFISLGQLLSSHRLLHSCQAARTCAICRSCLLGLAGRDGSNESLAKAAPKPTKSWAYGRAHAAECHVPGSVIKKQLLLNTLRIAGWNTHCLEYLPLPTGATLSTHSSATQVATGPPMTTAWAVGSSIVTPLNHDMEALQKTQCFTSQDLGTAVYLWLLNDVAPKKRRQRITSLGQSNWATRTDLEAGRAPKSINNFRRVERPTQLFFDLENWVTFFVRVNVGVHIPGRSMPPQVISSYSYSML